MALLRSKEIVEERLVGRVGLLGLLGVFLLQALLLDCIESTCLISVWKKKNRRTYGSLACAGSWRRG